MSTMRLLMQKLTKLLYAGLITGEKGDSKE